MQQVISNSQSIKGIGKKNEKRKAIETFNFWLSKIGKNLNTSQLANYK